MHRFVYTAPGVKPMLPKSKAHGTREEQESQDAKRTRNKGRPPICNHQCNAHRGPCHVLRPKSMYSHRPMSRHDLGEFLQCPTICPTSKNLNKFHDLEISGTCRSCAPRGQPLQLNIKPRQVIIYNIQCKVLQGCANYNNYSPPQEMRPRIATALI